MKRVFHMDILAIFFGLGTWLSINGVWAEMPLFVGQLPESWSLPSYLSIITQIANVAPIIYILFNYLIPTIVTDKRTIYIILFISVSSTIFFSLFWNETVIFEGKEHSIGFIGLSLCLALTVCSSRILYVPFMARFHEIYLTSFFIGEGLCNFLPGALAFMQGIEKHGSNCNAKTLEEFQPTKFSIRTFFLALTAFNIFAMLSFILLNMESVTKNALALPLPMKMEIHASKDEKKVNTSTWSRIPISKEEMVLLLLQTLCSCFCNGVFPAIQSYSCLPYGVVSYFWANNLSHFANPVTSALMTILPAPTKCSVCYVFIVSIIVSTYVMITGLTSPHPPLVGTVTGSVIMVISWIFLISTFTYVRVASARMVLEIGNKEGLFYWGVATQIGAFVGALTSFSLVNFSTIFSANDPCSYS